MSKHHDSTMVHVQGLLIFLQGEFMKEFYEYLLSSGDENTCFSFFLLYKVFKSLQYMEGTPEFVFTVLSSSISPLEVIDTSILIWILIEFKITILMLNKQNSKVEIS